MRCSNSAACCRCSSSLVISGLGFLLSLKATILKTRTPRSIRLVAQLFEFPPLRALCLSLRLQVRLIVSLRWQLAFNRCNFYAAGADPSSNCTIHGA